MAPDRIPPGPDPRPATSVTVILGIVTGLAALWCLLGLVIVISGATAPGPGEEGFGSRDPHGFGLIFGTACMLVPGVPVLLAAGVPFARRIRWARSQQ